MGINTRLLAGSAVVVLLLGVSSQISNHAFADSSTAKYAHANSIAKVAGEQAAKDLAVREKSKVTPPGALDSTG